MLGFTQEELVGAPSDRLWRADALPSANVMRQAALRGETVRATHPLVRRDGRTVWLDISLRPYTTDDGRQGAAGSAHDVTELMQSSDDQA